MRHFYNDALLSAGALLIVLIALMAFDDRVRHQVTSAIAGASPAGIAAAGGQMQHVAEVLLTAARTQGIAHAPIVVFVVAATALVLFMLRL